MIDVHCHLEQENYSKNRDEVIDSCKKELKAVITCCAHPKDFDLTMQIVEKYKGFVFATVGIHPEYVKEISENEKKEFLEKIKENKDKIVGIGEIGLDFYWVKEKEWQEKQKELFIELINFAKELNLPLIIHSREAYDEAVRILEQENAKNVLLHMFGANHLVKKVIENNWFVSMNTIVLKSKKHKKVVRDTPLEKIMLETDAPFLGVPGKRSEPTIIRDVAQKIAEIKKMSFDKVWYNCGSNAVHFFNLQNVKLLT
jgi:TatD DNase family protein